MLFHITSTRPRWTPNPHPPPHSESHGYKQMSQHNMRWAWICPHEPKQILNLLSVTVSVKSLHSPWAMGWNFTFWFHLKGWILIVIFELVGLYVSIVIRKIWYPFVTGRLMWNSWPYVIDSNTITSILHIYIYTVCINQLYYTWKNNYLLLFIILWLNNEDIW